VVKLATKTGVVAVGLLIAVAASMEGLGSVRFGHLDNDQDERTVIMSVSGNYVRAMVKHNLGRKAFAVTGEWSETFKVAKGTELELVVTRAGTALVTCVIAQEGRKPVERPSTAMAGTACYHTVA
jgi:hypothetical protein